MSYAGGDGPGVDVAVLTALPTVVRMLCELSATQGASYRQGCLCTHTHPGVLGHAYGVSHREGRAHTLRGMGGAVYTTMDGRAHALHVMAGAVYTTCLTGRGACAAYAIAGAGRR